LESGWRHKLTLDFHRPTLHVKHAEKIEYKIHYFPRATKKRGIKFNPFNKPVADENEGEKANVNHSLKYTLISTYNTHTQTNAESKLS
jgi:hypothetical protein